MGGVSTISSQSMAHFATSANTRRASLTAALALLHIGHKLPNFAPRSPSDRQPKLSLMQYNRTLRLIDSGCPASEGRDMVWPGMTRPKFYVLLPSLVIASQ